MRGPEGSKMHFSFLEKLGTSALLCAWLVYGANIMGGTLVHVREHRSSMEVATAPAGAQPGSATAQQETDLGTLLAAAAPADGEKVFNKCKACHTIEKGGPNKVGPNMWNVVGGPKAHIEGFAYSNALAAMHGQSWSYENLDAFLTNPKSYVPGTKMTFAGLSAAKDRASVIRYLAANTENPPPFPEPAPKTAAAPVSEPAAAGSEASQTVAATGEPDAAQMPAATSATSGGAATAAAPASDLKTLLASADPTAGEKVFNKCKACHNAEKGGANQVGPNLWNIVGAPIAHHEGFNYSSALAGKSGGTWTYEDLDTYLKSPKTFAPGTKMTFAGLNKPDDRANVIAFLRSRSDSPPPLP
jgi:cytochrome c